tara:strand:- start:817 stop:948 length:132 start_codon:yes stop_codon:yes gene_type:complete
MSSLENTEAEVQKQFAHDRRKKIFLRAVRTKEMIEESLMEVEE